LQIIFYKRTIKYRSLLRKTTYKDKGSYETSPPCSLNTSQPQRHATPRGPAVQRGVTLSMSWIEDRQICFLYVTNVLMGGGFPVGENVGLISIWMVLGNK